MFFVSFVRWCSSSAGSGGPAPQRRSTPRRAPANPVEALLDGGEARLDHRLELGVGEDVEPVVLDGFGARLPAIGRVDALVDPLANRPDRVGDRAGGRRTAELAGEALGQVAP